MTGEIDTHSRRTSTRPSDVCSLEDNQSRRVDLDGPQADTPHAKGETYPGALDRPPDYDMH